MFFRLFLAFQSDASVKRSHMSFNAFFMFHILSGVKGRAELAIKRRKIEPPKFGSD